MKDTKQRILEIALELFARDGYEAVSVSMIAGELGITKGALYRHYKSKRDIFDSIVERMYRLDAERSGEYRVPEKRCEEQPEEYGKTSPESIRSFTIGQFRFWTEDDFASSFRKLLTLEQFRNEEMQGLYQQYLASGPVEYVKDLFQT